jgi:uncharacterized coiled-coil protein SlyX
MKFSLAIENKNNSNIGSVQGHNTRAHQTASQLPAAAWITPQGRHQIVGFNEKLVADAKLLAKRKDAVLAVELVIQVGNQTDWRELPTEQFPFGQGKGDPMPALKALVEGVKKAAFAEFGKERIISIELHTDESTPHAHIVFAPIFEGKLQAKRWLDGASSCAALRERIHGHVTRHIQCTYEKGAIGGAPHDKGRAAGGAKAPKPEAGFIEKTINRLSGSSTINQLKTANEALNLQIQTLFSKLKKAESQSIQETKNRKAAEAHTKAIEFKAYWSDRELREEIELLKKKIADLTPATVKTVAPGIERGPAKPYRGMGR